MDRYTVVSSDCHAGAALLEYRDYLDPAFRDDFDDWAATYVSPFQDLSAPEAARNWDDALRNASLDEDGIAGEVLYPNTVPPFFPGFVLFAGPPKPEDYEHRLAGIRAHGVRIDDLSHHTVGQLVGGATVVVPIAHAQVGVAQVLPRVLVLPPPGVEVLAVRRVQVLPVLLVTAAGVAVSRDEHQGRGR